jgi:transposase-like protein
VKLALNMVFPAAQQLLCLFHINRNVLEHAKKTWQMDNSINKEQKQAVIAKCAAVQATWNHAVCSHTPAEFTKQFKAMCVKYADQPTFVTYLRTKQEPQKELVVQVWTSLIQHFGNNANSALEGSHKVAKAFL